MSTLFGGKGAHPTGAALHGDDDLLGVFRGGEKPSDRFGIGIEYERLPVCMETGRAVPYAAPGGGPSIEGLLEAMAASSGWTAQREDGHVIALERAGTRVTLEPGAQVELSSRVHRDLDAARSEVMGFVDEMDGIAASSGISLLGLGYHPFTDHDDIGWVPKSRYKIMAPYLARRGHLAHAMMKGTAGCQLNLDYADEDDAMEKLRVAMALSPVVTALCANSPLARGQANGFATKRSHIWLHTDRDRTGLLAFALREGARYADYVAYALDVPMLFVVRDGQWIDMTGRTFRRYLGGDNTGLAPSVSDWELHLTTLFPEVRLKGYVEVRGSDSAGPEQILGQAALWKGLLYGARERDRAWRLVGDLTLQERHEFQRDVARRGLSAATRMATALEIAQELIRLAESSLGPTESHHLAPLREIAFTERVSPSESVLARWRGEWDRIPRRLVAGVAAPRARAGGLA